MMTSRCQEKNRFLLTVQQPCFQQQRFLAVPNRVLCVVHKALKCGIVRGNESLDAGHSQLFFDAIGGSFFESTHMIKTTIKDLSLRCGFIRLVLTALV